MRPFQIYLLQVTWHGCQDARPWLILQARPDDLFGCFPISSQCYGQDCFPIEPSDPECRATGLTRACYVICTRIYDLRWDLFIFNGKPRLKDELLWCFREFAGV